VKPVIVKQLNELSAVLRTDDINLKLIPFLTNYTLSGVKLLDLERFKKASILIENKMHLTPVKKKIKKK
jgi:hypothetical protein